MSERRWDIYVRDMLDCCERITAYAANQDRSAFFADDLRHDAVLWNITILGEAAGRIPGAVREAHSEIPWHAITGMRNNIVHGYDGIDDNTVWEVIQEGIPELMPHLRALLSEAEGQGGTGAT